MELTDGKEYKYDATEAEIKRAQLGGFLLGNSLPVSLSIYKKSEGLNTEEAIYVLAGNIALLQQLSEASEQGITHISELKSEAAKTVRTGIEVLGLIDQSTARFY